MPTVYANPKLYALRYNDWHVVYREEVQRYTPQPIVPSYTFKSGHSREEMRQELALTGKGRK